MQSLMGNAKSDAATYRGGYPGQVEPPLTQQHSNYDFYMNAIATRPDGAFIDKIHVDWFGNYRLLEENHSFIQWLFPIREHGVRCLRLLVVLP